MFVGHLGVGLALKKIEPKINLGILFFASLFIDILLGLFILAGLEQVMVPNAYSQLHYLNFSFPYSHSLLAVVIWSLILFGVTYLAWAGDSRSKIKASMVISAAAFLHWICDWVEHPPQLPVAGNNSNMLGLGLWDNLEIALALEVVLVAVGTILYLNAAKKIGRTGRWGIVTFMILLTSVAIIGQISVTQAPEQNAFAISIITQAVLVCTLAAWIDRNRENIA